MSIDIIKDEIYKAMINLYHGIARVDLISGNALILSSSQSDEIGNEYEWDSFFSKYVEEYFLPSDRIRAIATFNVAELKERFQKKKEYLFSVDLASYVINKNEKNVTMTAFRLKSEEESPYVYVVIRNSGEDYLLKSIVNWYVYDNCDYFIYLDAKHNSYTMFSGQVGTPLPPEVCTDYEKALVEYANTFVVEEDREMVIREMHLPRVLEGIEKNGVHSFTCGIIEGGGKFTRKRLDYRYYDKKNQMILLSRTDITDIYLEEEKKRLELEKALLRAQTDPLTKLLNFQATVDKITERLLKTDECFALYFIDLDNFKKINDTYGHLKGDEVLRSIAGCFKAIKQEDDIVGRVGGDEFVFFANVGAGREYAIKIAEKICYAIHSIKIDGLESRITGSVGVALSSEVGNSYDVLVQRADERAYEAKSAGKNQYSF